MSTAPPFPFLSKETVGVWHGWGNIGDKEVVREAAAKGLHVDLAITFLSHRRKIELKDAKIWFREEVLKWVHELLERRQIFKVSHVLNNVKLSSTSELSRIFYTTTDNRLRDYIGNHLQKSDQLDENLQQLWTFLNLLLENKDLVALHKLTGSLESLDALSDVCKSEIATALLLKSENSHLDRFLNGETLWKCLLINNDLSNLLSWINIKFKSSSDDIVQNSLTEQFKKFQITNQMIDLVSSKELNVTAYVRNEIYDAFGRFGIFQREEKNDVVLILRRLKNSFSIPNLYDILTKTQSVVNTASFIHLLIDYCLEKNYLHIISICLKDFKIPPSRNRGELKLMNEFRLLVKDFNECLLSRNILNVSKVLSSDIINYFIENPLIFLCFLFFNTETDIINAILIGETLVADDLRLNNCLLGMLKHFKVLNEISLREMNGSPSCRLNIYDLIYSHLGEDGKFLSEFRIINGELSQFYTREVQNFGYSKKLDYKFYLKESRPSVAARSFILDQLLTDDQKRTEKKVCKLAITNFDCVEISSSCVSFSEIMSLDSMSVRVLLGVAKVLHDSNYGKEFIAELLLSSEEDPYSVQNLLETILMKIIESKSLLIGSDLIEAFRIYEIVIQFSKINSIKLPELFLRFCASRNLWLPFLLLAQIYDYPLDQIKLLIQFFKSPNMLEHLTHGVVNIIQVEEKNVLIRDRDSRNYLLSKVGVRKNIDTLKQYSSHSIKSQSSLESEGSSSSSDIFEIDVSNIKATLLQTLIRCHNSTDPPKALLQACQLYRNPFLAVLATSYEPDSLITNWLTWLSVCCGMCKVFTNYETTAISATAVTALLENCMKNRFPRTILESFEIFMPENPLKLFMEFLNNCSRLNFNFALLALKLNAFEAHIKTLRKNSIINETDHEMTYLTNRIWIEMTAVRLLSALLEYNCDSLYEQILIFENLCKIEVWKYFSCECPNFKNILMILENLYTSNSGVRLNISIAFDTRNSRQAIISCINDLLERRRYGVALKVAQIVNLPPDLILVKEWQNKMNDRSDKNFWYICDETFTKFNVTADCVVDFYLECSEKIVDLLEKFISLKLAWQWAAKYDLTCQYELEKKMWLAYLWLEEKHKNLEIFDIKPSTYLYRDLAETLKDISQYESELNKDFQSQLERILEHVLDKNHFWLALRLQRMFKCKNPDLETLKLCHSLAEGILLPHQLNTEQRLLLSNVSYLRTYSHRRTLLSTKFSSLSSYSHGSANSLQIDSVDSYMCDTLAILKLLTEHLHNGKEIGENIFMSYRISVNIEIPYQAVVMSTDYMKILKDALENNCTNKLDVVHDFILAFKWSKQEIADFICEEVINAAVAYTDMNLEQPVMWDLNLDQDFQLVLQLLQDCSLLGYKIYSYANTLHKSQIESTRSFKSSDLALVIELLIRTHDSFTADCNMEGISKVLKKSKEVVANLLVLQDWKLMVRLLTGVARYTEMNYILQILKENEQFEFLLRKGSRKDNGLKVALLEYLKKYCPENKDLYKIVALHFALFSEVALLWEREAQNIVKNLISISILEMQNNKLNVEDEPFVLLQNTESTRMCLNKTMSNYIHATDFHLEGEKLTLATNSAKQAELIAMQLAFLKDVSPNSSVVCLLNLKNSQIADLIISKLNFQQSLILVEAYNFHTDWAAVLYEQYIVRNNVPFLEGFLKHLPLTDALAQDISRKFVTANINSVNEIKCMKNVLNMLNSLHVKYRIASELGFVDLVEDLIASGQLVYLKDTVWKKGYRN